jgi:hypothetical protein
MAWEDYECGGVWILSGDTPFDEMSGVVERLHKKFLERWGRPPYVAELLYALLSHVDLYPNRPVADETLPSLDALIASVGGLAPAEHIDPGDYEAALDAESNDFLIYPRTAAANPHASLAVRGAITRPGDGSIVCRYETPSPTITDRMAHCLIRYCVLQEFFDYDLTDRDLLIHFERRPPCDPT